MLSWWNSWIIKTNFFCATNLLKGITFICQSWELYFTPCRLLSYTPLPNVSSLLHPTVSSHFSHLHCILVYTIWLSPLWKCQLNGAGLVSSASSRALVSVCVHVCECSGFTKTGCCVWGLGARPVRELVFTCHPSSERTRVRSRGHERSSVRPDRVVNSHTLAMSGKWMIWFNHACALQKRHVGNSCWWSGECSLFYTPFVFSACSGKCATVTQASFVSYYHRHC